MNQSLNTATKQFIEMICNGGFLSKDIGEAWMYPNSLVENSQARKTEDASEWSQPIVSPTTRATSLSLVRHIAVRLIIHTKKVNDLLIKRLKLVKSMEEIHKVCDIHNCKAISLEIIQLFQHLNKY